MNGGGQPPPYNHQQISDTSIAINTEENNGSSPRLYQVWKGRNIFCFGGRLILGPDSKSLFLTTSLIVIPVVLFCAFVAKDFINEFPHHLGVLIMLFTILPTILVIYLLFVTATMDPGIIPRNARPLEPDDDDSSNSTDWAESHPGGYFLPPTKEVVVNGIVVKIKYCPTCMLYRPPRCSHCSVCNNCVDRFDHHCPWIGQCIGKRNYRFFFMFVLSTTVVCLYIFAICCANIKRVMEVHHCILFKALLKTPTSTILIIYTFLAAWFVGGLTIFHLYLIATNQTTYENFRYRYDAKGNPYNLGFTRNFKEVFWSMLPRSSNNFREKVKVYFHSNSTTSHSSSVHSTPKISKANTDVEIGRREAVDAQEFDDVRNQFQGERRSDVV